jgi:hypothetical protein
MTAPRTYLLVPPHCLCGAPLRGRYYIACPSCWRHVPAMHRDKHHELAELAPGSPDHLAVMRTCWTHVRRRLNAEGLPVKEFQPLNPPCERKRK